MTNSAPVVFEPDGRGGGHLRASSRNYRVRPDDIVVRRDVCSALGLRGGETIGAASMADSKRRPRVLAQAEDVESINDCPVGDYLETKPFDELTAISPDRRLHFETEGGPTSMRIVDLLTPIGFGQRGLIVAAPRTGKTVLLQQMAAGVAANHPDAYMIVLLVDERPEEVTDMRRTIHGEVVASSNDENIASHVRIARLIKERAKRLVECGRDVVILLDSLTRLGRAFNASIRAGGRIMSGGLDIRALTEPKAIFGAARNVEEGGSLTIIASCLVETGSRMDDVIFNEFKGTGNMEIMLIRALADRRIWPAIDLERSGTRKEEQLLDAAALNVSHRIRRSLTGKDPARAMEMLIELMEQHPTNQAFIRQFPEARFR